MPKPKQKKAVNRMFSVLSSDGELICKTPRISAIDLVKQSVAIELPGVNCIRLIPNYGEYQEHRSYTGRIGRKPTPHDLMAASLGNSQVYTTCNEMRRVDGFKTIYAEDRHIFHAATLDCLSA